MKLSKQQLMDILNVKKEGLKTMERKQQLYVRLQEKGYKLSNKIKEGRQVYYIVDKENSNKELLTNIYDTLMNTKQYDQFTDYLLYRVLNIHKPITKNYIADQCEVNKNTITKWDKTMVFNNMLSKDGYFYIAIDYKEDNIKEYRITTKEEYTSYMKASIFAGRKKYIAQQYKNGNIDYNTMQLLMDGLTLNQKAIEKRFVYRVNKLNLIKDNQLLKDIMLLIQDVYTDKELNNYYLDWMQTVEENKN